MVLGKVVKGFTLIEMLLVLVILATAAAVTIPNIGSGQDSTRLKSAARDIVSALRYARGQALIQHQETQVMLNLENNSYGVTGREKHYFIADNIALTLDTAESEMVDEGIGGIRFFPDGSSTGGRVSLELHEVVMQVDINWLTGEISIIDKDAED